MLTFLECLCHMLSIFVVREFTIPSSTLLSRIESVLRFLMKFINFSIKWSSSSLFLARAYFVVWICSLAIDISTEMEVWSEVSLQSRWIWWLFCSVELGQRKTRFKTEFESWLLSEYLVGKNSVGLEIFNWKESAILKRVSLWREWYWKLGSQRQSLMLKLPIIMRTLLRSTSVSLRYFKADWDKSEYTLNK